MTLLYRWGVLRVTSRFERVVGTAAGLIAFWVIAGPQLAGVESQFLESPAPAGRRHWSPPLPRSWCSTSR